MAVIKHFFLINFIVVLSLNLTAQTSIKQINSNNYLTLLDLNYENVLTKGLINYIFSVDSIDISDSKLEFNNDPNFVIKRIASMAADRTHLISVDSKKTNNNYRLWIKSDTKVISNITITPHDTNSYTQLFNILLTEGFKLKNEKKGKIFESKEILIKELNNNFIVVGFEGFEKSNHNNYRYLTINSFDKGKIKN